MNEQQQETLSALFDGETSEFETRRLLNELSDEEQQRWQRYQLIRDASTNQLAETDFSFNIADSVMDAIADEEIDSVEKTPTQSNSKQSWLKPFIGFSAAASVAFVTVLGIQSPDMVKPGFVAAGNVSLSQLPVSGELGLNAVSAKTSAATLVDDVQQLEAQKAEDIERMQAYIQQHNQHAAFNNGKGLLPMARMDNGEN
jgi:sigma-E factor negative regulatory protein RseA